ncbi:MAG: glucose-6-phosphate isomerase [Cumulibacter sp.]
MHLDCRAPSDLSTTIADLVRDKIASAVMAQDPTLWGAAAESEAAQRLGWVDLPETSRPLLAAIEALSAELREDGLDRIVLSGMGGSSLAPEVICATDGVPLITLDSTDPHQVAAAFDVDLERTVLVVSSKSGTTVETDSHRRYAIKRFSEAGIDPASRIVIVTDPGSPLQTLAEESGYRRVFEANPHVGGRYSALTAFGLVPAGLAGADISSLLDDAAEVAELLGSDNAENPAVQLGALLGGAERAGAEKLVLASRESANVDFGAWAEQLIAESSGKVGRGILPVVVEDAAAPGFAGAGSDAVLGLLGPGEAPVAASGYALATDGPLGAQFLLWEMAIAIASRVIGVNPFDQPNVEEAKRMARALLDEPTAEQVTPALEHDCLSVTVLGGALGAPTTLASALSALLNAAAEDGYVAVMAYLDRHADVALRASRPLIAQRSDRQTTFGWGPRFLHSTGQYHKGGHPNGVFLQITADSSEDAAVPDRPYTFGSLQRAQAAGDAQVLAEQGRPVLHVHLSDRSAGITALLTALNAEVD